LKSRKSEHGHLKEPEVTAPLVPHGKKGSDSKAGSGLSEAGLQRSGFKPGIPKSDKDIEREIAAGTRTLVVGPYLTRRAQSAAEFRMKDPRPLLRLPEARLEEAVGLAAAIELDVIEKLILPLSTPRPATLLGKGKVDELAGLVLAQEIDLVVVDAPLTPVQQRNLEKAFSAKVIDRTGLILEIFGSRAQTREGVLQVELAHLGYQKSRLVRSWTHLERQRGGFGFLGGPGETQIEADRRQIQDRMGKLERELDAVKRTRGLHRESRKRVPYPVVALVGYTNAGKSTLFNRLTKADVLAENMLFATLDPTARAVKLPQGTTVMLSDTVGFISELPTTLVAAFRATLEDAIEADLLLHVRDVSHEDTEAQAQDVEAILTSLGVAAKDGRHVIEVWNKADLLPADEQARQQGIAALKGEDERPMLVSAVTGEGIDGLLARIERRVATDAVIINLSIDASDGEGLAWLYRQGEVLSRADDENGTITLSIRTIPQRRARIEARFGGASLI
jgi:GTPase